MNTNTPKPASRRKRPPTKKLTKPKRRSVPSAQSPPNPSTFPFFPQLSSINIAKLLNGFMSFRTNIRNLSQSLQRMESMMDSAYQMFAIASQMMGSNRRRGLGPGRFPALPPFGGQLPPGNSSPGPFPALPPFGGQLPPGNSPHTPANQYQQSFPLQDENIPVLPFDDPPGPRMPNFPFTPFLQNMNIGQLINILRSPMFQKMMSTFFKTKK